MWFKKKKGKEKNKTPNTKCHRDEAAQDCSCRDRNAMNHKGLIKVIGVLADSSLVKALSCGHEGRLFLTGPAGQGQNPTVPRNHERPGRVYPLYNTAQMCVALQGPKLILSGIRRPALNRAEALLKGGATVH